MIERLTMEANKLASTAERIAVRALETNQIAEAAPMLRELRSDIERIRNQIAWEQRHVVWTYPMQPSWTN